LAVDLESERAITRPKPTAKAGAAFAPRNRGSDFRRGAGGQKIIRAVALVAGSNIDRQNLTELLAR
jgi:hypothetical protein